VSGVLGIDLGERRIGVAIADGPGVGARPLTTLRRGRHVGIDSDALLALITTHAITEIVVGLPIDAAGHEGPQAALTRTWVDDIRGRLGDDIAITLHDERLSSHVAEGRVVPMKRGRSGGPPSRKQRDEYRARIDREAAAVILQDALDTRQPGSRRSQQPSTPETPR
jgi:putative Holliday junction resolvase